MPKPKRSSNGKFELRTISEADSRYHVVKLLRQRVQRMIEDVNATTLAKEMLVSRAVYLASYLESEEIAALEGKEMNWRIYLMAVRALADVLGKLGLEKAVAGAKRLEDYVFDQRHKNGKRRH